MGHSSSWSEGQGRRGAHLLPAIEVPQVLAMQVFRCLAGAQQCEIWQEEQEVAQVAVTEQGVVSQVQGGEGEVGGEQLREGGEGGGGQGEAGQLGEVGEGGLGKTTAPASLFLLPPGQSTAPGTGPPAV